MASSPATAPLSDAKTATAHTAKHSKRAATSCRDIAFVVDLKEKDVKVATEKETGRTEVSAEVKNKREGTTVYIIQRGGKHASIDSTGTD